MSTKTKKNKIIFERDKYIMDPRYENAGDIITRTIEECAEVIHILCKVRRFGWFNHHPDDPKKVKNYELVSNELNDLETRIKQLRHEVDHQKTIESFGGHGISVNKVELKEDCVKMVRHIWNDNVIPWEAQQVIDITVDHVLKRFGVDIPAKSETTVELKNCHYTAGRKTNDGFVEYHILGMADGVKGHYCIGRKNQRGNFWEFYNKGKWLSACEVLTKKRAIALIKKLTKIVK